MKLGSATGTLAIIEDGRLVREDIVGVAAALVRTAQPALLSVYPGQMAEEQRAVRLVGRPEIPSGTIGIGADLAKTLGIEPGLPGDWAVTTEGVQHVSIRELSLELAVERPLEQAVADLNRSKGLFGALLLVNSDEEIDSLSMTIGEDVYRVRAVTPKPIAGAATILEVTDATRIQLFAPGSKSGVDIVILADCSGSMHISDLTETPEVTGGSLARSLFGSPRPVGLKRSEALRRALKRLLDLRLSLAGRVSRIALVGFNTRCVVRFPRGGGMQDMDESSSPAVVKEFGDAISLLQEESAGTDIGQALQFAAELLYHNGHPANDRLIVLVSDGAHWVPRNAEETGEETIAIKEPVSLMTHLHRDMKIHLHAIGISTPEIFMRWFNSQVSNRGREPEGGYIPNHTLLEELVRVGGGDPSRVGDTEVLEAYFSGLGTGVMRRVDSPQRVALPEPAAEEFALFQTAAPARERAAAAGKYQAEIESLGEEIGNLYVECNRYVLRETQAPLFRMTTNSFDFMRLFKRQVGSREDFQAFILGIDQAFFESRNKLNRFEHMGPIDSVLNDGRLRDLHALRIDFAHDTELPPPDPRRSNPDNLKRAGDTVRRLVGVSHIESDDPESWSRLQVAVLREIRSILDDVRKACRTVAEAPRPDAELFMWKE